VHAFDSGAEGDIDSVVDQERYVGRFGDLVQLFGIVNELCCVALFVTVLYNDDSTSPTTFHCSLDHSHEVFVSQDSWCRVCHQIYRVVYA
jgi:hypothetical protein